MASEKEVMIFHLSRKVAGLLLLCGIPFNKWPTCKAFVRSHAGKEVFRDYKQLH